MPSEPDTNSKTLPVFPLFFVDLFLSKKESGERFQIPEKIKMGERDDTLYREACSLVGQGHRKEIIEETLRTTNARICEPPLEKYQVEKIVASAEKKRAVQEEKKEKANQKYKAQTISKFSLWEQLGLSMQSSGIPHTNLDNAVRVMNGIESLREAIWFDEFKKRVLTVWNSPLREWSDTDDLHLLTFFQKEMGISRMTKQTIQDAVDIHSKIHKQNEFVTWIKALPWDQKERVDSFFSFYMGSTMNEYIKAVSTNFWVGMVARGVNPGCQVDNVVILEGGQGVYKSSALRAIGGEWFSEIHGSIKEKDFLISLQGKLILEIGEMDSFSKAEVNLIKGMITNRVDRFRAPWDKRAQDYPRSCVFVGSTNDSAYLRDVTGGRRFWPIRISEQSPIDLNLIKKDRSQLFAEAYYKFQHGESWWKVPETAIEEQESRRESDEWETIIKNYLAESYKERFSIIEIAKESLKIESCDLDMMTQKRIAKCLRVLKMTRRKSDGIFVWIRE